MADARHGEEMAPTADDPDDDGQQLVAAARAAAKLARQVTIPLGEIDLSLPQYRVLAFLDEGGAAPSDLAGRLSVSRPSVTALMDGLITRGLAPGGLLVYETFGPGQCDRHDNHLKNPDFVLAPGELRSLYNELELVRYEEVELPDRCVGRLVARRPGCGV